MPRYFFQIRDGERVFDDPDGTDHLDLNAAHAEAVRGARDIMAEQLQEGVALSPQSIAIRNDDELILAVVRFQDVIQLGW